MLRRALFALLILFPFNAHAFLFGDDLPKGFMIKTIEGPGLQSGVTPAQFEALFKKMGGTTSYKKGDDGAWVMVAEMKSRTEVARRQFGREYTIELQLAPGAFMDSLQVKGLSIAGEPQHGIDMATALRTWENAILMAGIQ